MTTSPAAKGLSLQWKMLIGFMTGLILGLIAYSTQRGYGRSHAFVGELRTGIVAVVCA